MAGLLGVFETISRAIRDCSAPLLETWVAEPPVRAAGVGVGVGGSSVQGKREHDQEVKQEAQTERGRNGVSSLKQWKPADCS